MDVGGQKSDEKQDEQDSSNATESRYEQTHRSRDFANSGEIDHESWLWNPGWRHSNKILFHGREVRTGSEKQHGGQGAPGRRGPRRKERDAGESERPEEEQRENQNEENKHVRVLALID
jgi:hypothetical protein